MVPYTRQIMNYTDDSPIQYPIDGTLDLHQFAPEDTKEVVEEYIRVCLEQKIYSLRIIHGKGEGVKRRLVQSILEKNPNVAQFKHEGGSGGSWGATVVDLKNWSVRNKGNPG